MKENSVDVLIVGGGIAGLWTAINLKKLGYSVVVFEKHSLGSGQSIYSQGIIHGGYKYSLQGVLSPFTKNISAMPAMWDNALKGNGSVTLKNTEIYSQKQGLWPVGNIPDKVVEFFARKTLKGNIVKGKSDKYPQWLDKRYIKPNFFYLSEKVLNIHSCFVELQKQLQGNCVQFNINKHTTRWRKENGNQTLIIPQLLSKIRAQKIILTAGKGNENLINQIGIRKSSMQLRPLHMVMVKHKNPLPIYVHCIGNSHRPLLTITSHPMKNNFHVWYIGGDIAEKGVDMRQGELIDLAKKRIQKYFPHIELPQAVWNTNWIERAEVHNSLVIPDSVYVQEENDFIVGWPTKLALAPAIADKFSQIIQKKIKPQFKQVAFTEFLLPARVTKPFWEYHF